MCPRGHPFRQISFLILPPFGYTSFLGFRLVLIITTKVFDSELLMPIIKAGQNEERLPWSGCPANAYYYSGME